MNFPVLWSIFVIYIIIHHGLRGFSGLIKEAIAAARGALGMLHVRAHRKIKQCKWDTYVRPLTRDITIRRLSFFRKNDKFVLTKGFEKCFKIKGSEIRT